MTVRTSVVAALFMTASLFAASDSDNDRAAQIQSKLNTIINKAGIHFNGTFRSQYLQSMLDVENSGDSAIDWRKKKTESNEFTSVDFDLGARPNEALSARCMFRMHQNWQNFFSDVANPIFLRWLSIDGNIKDMFRFSVGDYRSRYSPLTMWSPDIDIPYEPEIFAEKRRQAMNEVFLGNNDRLLQGVNLNFDAEVVPIMNELHVNLQAARLRLSETSNTNGSSVMAPFDDSKYTPNVMDRYVAGCNIDLLVLRGLGIGGTLFDIFDLPATSSYTSTDSARLEARQTLVFGARVAPSTKIFLDSDVFDVGLNFESANSLNRDSAWFEASGTDSSFKTKNVLGSALDVGLTGNIRIGTGNSIKVNVGFMNNDSNYVNEMAQSPTFLGQRIMNIENDYMHSSRLYTTFDALYDYVFKFTPSANNVWNKEPRRKISYNSAILDKKELGAVDGKNVRFDPALQTVLPFGAATPNRSGLKGNLSLKLFNGGIDAGAKIAMLNEVTPLAAGDAKTAFTQFGGGLSIDIATWAKVLNCMKFSVGYMLESANNAGNPAIDGSKEKFSSGFLNLGLYWNFWQRFSLLGGFQQIASTNDIEGTVPFTYDLTQTHWAAGLEYKVNETQKVVARFGQLGATPDDSRLTDELNKANSFKATQVEAYIVVNF